MPLGSKELCWKRTTITWPFRLIRVEQSAVLMPLQNKRAPFSASCFEQQKGSYCHPRKLNVFHAEYARTHTRKTYIVAAKSWSPHGRWHSSPTCFMEPEKSFAAISALPSLHFLKLLLHRPGRFLDKRRRENCKLTACQVALLKPQCPTGPDHHRRMVDGSRIAAQSGTATGFFTTRCCCCCCPYWQTPPLATMGHQ